MHPAQAGPSSGQQLILTRNLEEITGVLFLYRCGTSVPRAREVRGAAAGQAMLLFARTSVRGRLNNPNCKRLAQAWEHLPFLSPASGRGEQPCLKALNDVTN